MLQNVASGQSLYVPIEIWNFFQYIEKEQIHVKSLNLKCS